MSKINSKISIIIPIYNSEDYLKKCIESVINQTYTNIEIILIDDGSTDNSLKICDEYKMKDSRIKVIHKENGGVSNTRNFGIENATGEFIMFVDSDDYISLNLVEDLLNNFENCDLVKAVSVTIKNNKKYIVKNYDRFYDRKSYIKEILAGKLGGAAFGYLFKRQEIKNIRFDEKTSCMEDTLFVIEYILKNVSKVKIIDSCFYNRLVNENSITTNKTKIIQNINDYLYSLESIEKYLQSSNELSNSLKLDILRKKIYIIESEIAKLDNIKQIENIFDNEKIKDILEETKDIEIGLRYKIFIYSFIHKNYLLMNIYLRFRKIAKKIKNGR